MRARASGGKNRYDESGVQYAPISLIYGMKWTANANHLTKTRFIKTKVYRGSLE
jgi:hypothetical protein